LRDVQSAICDPAPSGAQFFEDDVGSTATSSLLFTTVT
jgi:hypothetical protein